MNSRTLRIAKGPADYADSAVDFGIARGGLFAHPPWGVVAVPRKAVQGIKPLKAGAEGRMGQDSCLELRSISGICLPNGKACLQRLPI
jgi:hypothetical protein